MKKERFKRDVDECADKIKKILAEYNCIIEFCKELNAIIITDKDTDEFKEIGVSNERQD